MLHTNCTFLAAELMDVLRAFGCEEEDFTHYFSYYGGKFFNSIEYNGSFYDSEEEREVRNDLEYKRYARRYAKLALYNLLAARYGPLPWGALTGIRPTKLAYAEEAEGRPFGPLFRKFGVSEENIALTRSVLDAQRGIYGHGGGTDLFVSLPFCPTKCEYCSFITAPVAATKRYMVSYLDCLGRELESVRPLLANLKSVYVGGGTPFVLEERELERTYAAINAVLPRSCEYTVEAGRPDVFTEEKLKISRDYGVTRICVNPQSFNDETLVAIGRRHTAEQTVAAYEAARKYPFDVNCDLIAGLADETPQQFEYSVKRAAELGFDNITVHTLCLKSGAKLKENVKRLNVGGIGTMLALSREILSDAGYVPYYLYRQKYQAGGGENVGWTKPGKACVYNVDVMEEITHNVAVGANAVSKRIYPNEGKIERFGTPKDIKTYIDKTDRLIEDRLAFYE